MKKSLFLLTTFLLLSFIGFGQAYCNSNFTDVSFEYITNVNFAGINNPSGGTVGGPVDYTSQTATVSPGGGPYSLSVTIEADADEYIYAFIDWNQNGILDDAGEVYTVASGTSSSGPHTINIDVPVTAMFGNTRMRVMVVYDVTIPDPCYVGDWFGSYGEAEDYTVLVVPAGACLPPSNFVVSNITTTTATIDWDASTSNPSIGYAYEVRTSGAAGSGPTGLVSSGTESGLSVSLATMTPNTNHTFYIRAICSVGDSSIWMPKTFRTACDAATLPYIEDFEGAITPAMPPCTLSENAGTGNNWVTENNPGYGFSTKALKYGYNSNNAANAWFYTNGIPLTAGESYRLKFDYGAASTFFVEKLQVMYGSSADYLSMTDQVIDLPSVNNNVRKDTIIDFIATSTGVFYFGFNAYSASDQFNLYVDNIQITVTPTCDAPTSVQVANITSSDADISWDAPLIGAPASYSIYYSTTNTAPSLTTAPTISGISMTTETLTGLTAGTEYYVWIRSICSATDSSEWSNVKTFITPPGCGGNFYDPGGPSADYANNANSTTTIYPDNIGDVVSVTFNSFATENGWDGLMIYDGPDDTYPLISSGSTFNRATCPNGAWTGTTTFSAQGLTFTSTDASGALTFVFTSDGSGIAAGWIAAITCAPPPTCNEPTNIQIANITSSDADISWDAPTLGNSPASYSIYYSTTNTAPSLTDAPTISGVLTTTETLTGLTPASTYYVWVRSVCSATDSSSWSTVKTFTTECVPITTLPWTEGFEGVTTPAQYVFPTCWNYELLTGTGVGTSTTNDTYRAPRTGTNYMYTQYNTTAWIYTPAFELTAGNSYDFSFYMMNKDGTAGFTMDVAYGSSATEVDMVNVLETGYAATNTSYQQFKYTFTPSADGVYYFGIKSSANFSPWYLSFDDFKLEISPTCGEPTNIAVTNITTTGVDVSWDAPINGTITDYSWELRTSGAAGSGATGLVSSGTTATTNVTFNTLSSTTSYTFYVRANCTSPTDSSSYSSASFFTLIENDDCDNAMVLTDNVLVTATTVGATQSQAGQSCGGFTGNADDDVWFQFTATQNGNATITVTPATSGGITDIVVIAYSGVCGTLTQMGCADATTGANAEVVNLTGLTENETYYFRVYSYGGTEAVKGAFTAKVTGSALPVTYTNFTGKKEGTSNILSWTTATETNNIGYELERSADGNHFSKLDFIASKAINGNSNIALSYNYNDNKPLVGNNYYRLKQMDKDGKVNYSTVVLLKGDKATQVSITGVYPNPTRNMLNVNIASPSTEKVSIIITDITGKVLVQQSVVLNTGDNLQQLDVSKLSQGTYLIKTICNNGCESAVSRFVKF